MTYETYQIPENHIRTLQKFKAAKLTLQYLKEHGEEPPANVKAGFMDITQEDYNKYRDIFFALDFSNGLTGEGAIINTPDERPNTRYNEFVQCVYNVTNVYDETPLFNIKYGSVSNPEPTTRIGYMEIDGVPVTPCTAFTFSAVGTHRVDFLLVDSTTLDGVRFNNNKSIREITIPMSINDLGGYTFQDCSGIVKITILAEIPPKYEPIRNGQTFLNINKGGTLYIPKGCTEAYNGYFAKNGYNGSLGDYDWNIDELSK